MMAPSAVSPAAAPSRVSPNGTPPGAAERIAKPKSSSFAPDFVSMTLPGFRSRWITPRRCALSSASTIWIAVFERLRQRQRAARRRLLERLALDVLHDQVVDVVLQADVVERADVRMIQAGDDLRFALKPLAAVRIVRQMFRQGLDRDGAVQAGVEGAIDLAHAARGDQRLDIIGARRCVRQSGQAPTAARVGGPHWRGAVRCGRLFHEALARDS